MAEKVRIYCYHCGKNWTIAERGSSFTCGEHYIRQPALTRG